MRFFILISSFGLFLTSCANEGVIVRKDSAPLPFYHSLGIEGSHKLALRDRSGAVRSQLVTPQVFESYAQGGYFNDLQPGPRSLEPAVDIEPGPYIPPRTVQNPGNGQSPSGQGHRLAAHRIGPGTRPRLAKSSTSTKPTTARIPDSVAPKVQTPVVSGQFSAPVQEPVSIHRLSSLEKFPSTPAADVARAGQASATLQAPVARISKASTSLKSRKPAQSSETSSRARTMAFAAPGTSSTPPPAMPKKNSKGGGAKPAKKKSLSAIR